MESERLILASASPRRRELLGRMGLTFEVRASDVDERIEGLPEERVLALSIRKAEAAARGLEAGLVLAADTLVALDGLSLGKPADARAAKAMLSALSGRSHEVYTGVCLLDASSGRRDARVECTRVWFRPLSEAQIETYVETGEPMDKAGAYAIQGGAGAFVERIEGSFENVMGLPVQTLQSMLQEFAACGR